MSFFKNKIIIYYLLNFKIHSILMIKNPHGMIFEKLNFCYEETWMWQDLRIQYYSHDINSSKCDKIPHTIDDE